MSLQFATLLRNSQLDNIESYGGTNVSLLIYSGLPPAAVEDAPTGTLLVAIDLPADWMAAAAAGSKAKSGTWSATAVGTGTAGYFRLCNGSPTDVAFMQGEIETTGGSPSGVMGLDNTSISSGQTVTVTTFTLTDNNA